MPEIFELLLPLIVVLFVIFLAYISTKWISKKYNNINSGKHIKVIERIALNKDTSLVLIEIASKKHLLSVTSQKAEILLNFEEDELQQIDSPDNKTDFKAILSSVTNYRKPFEDKTDKKRKDIERENQ